MRLIDVHHLGRPHVIGSWEVDGIVIDPGPESTLETLIEALGGEEPKALLLTHIHLDHAAATGAMVKRWPDLQVYVHEKGAPHMVDPSKLLASAGRLYGPRMKELWGEILPVPAENVHALSGGETIFDLDVVYTPGHASHHVCFFGQDGTAFVGDVAGCRIPPVDVIVAPTPPPDIDVEVWEASIEAVRERRPERLALTHFDAVEEPEPHLDGLLERLRLEAEAVRGVAKEDYEADFRGRLAEEVPDGTLEELIQAVPIDYQWGGLERYWRKREERAAG
jgi:glyoxylase-like metal-dependent hydrolase (beta-lactamase superfamily II)